MLSAEKITLFELNQKVKEAFALAFKGHYWVIAEISETKENSSGHCYLELIQKEDINDTLKAKARATIWAYTYRMLKPYFETSTGRPLSAGMKVLVLVEVVFHEAHGYSLNITDIEPNFTLGDIEQKRREAIEKLVAEGVFDMNKSLEFPLLPKRVAVISSTTAAGLQDFVNQLFSNKYGYKVEHTLFAANMQGSGAEESIIDALNRIYESQNDFDIVAIIRGGGSQADLSCFDSYWLAAHVAQFPLPIITGIGHDKDTSVVDLVAHKKLKTPTAVAEFIIDKFFEAETIIVEFKERLVIALEDVFTAHKQQIEQPLKSLIPNIIQSTSNQKVILERKQSKFSLVINRNLASEHDYLLRTIKSFEIHSLMKLTNSKNSIKGINQSFDNRINYFFANHKNLTDRLEGKIESLNPINIFRMGYSLTTFNGKTLKDSKLVEKGCTIRTILNQGLIESTVNY